MRSIKLVLSILLLNSCISNAMESLSELVDQAEMLYEKIEQLEDILPGDFCPGDTVSAASADKEMADFDKQIMHDANIQLRAAETALVSLMKLIKKQKGALNERDEYRLRDIKIFVKCLK